MNHWVEPTKKDVIGPTWDKLATWSWPRALGISVLVRWPGKEATLMNHPTGGFLKGDETLGSFPDSPPLVGHHHKDLIFQFHGKRYQLGHFMSPLLLGLIRAYLGSLPPLLFAPQPP